MSIVSSEVVTALNQRAMRLGTPPATRVFGQRMKVHGELMERGRSLSEGAREAASSTEIEVQSSPWRGLGASPWTSSPSVKLHSRRPLEVLDSGRRTGGNC